MTKLIPAIFEHGQLRLMKRLNLPDHQKVLITVSVTNDDLSSLYINKLAEESQSYEFLNNPQEDIYSPSDGKPIE